MPQRRSKKIQVDGITCKNCGKVFDMSKFDDAFAHAKTHLKDNKTKSVDKLKALLIKKQFKVGGKRKMGERRTIDFLEEPGEPATHPKDRRDPRREGEGTSGDQRIPPSRVGFHPEGMHEMNSSDSSDLARKLTQGGNKGYTIPTGQKTGNKEQVQAMATLGHRNAFDNKSIDKLKALLNKDALDGKQSNRGKKRKPTNWVPWSSDEKKEEWTHMKPEDFLDVAAGYPPSDAHARSPPLSRYLEDPKTGKLVEQKPRRFSRPQGKQTKETYTKEDEEKGKKNDASWNKRGDELGTVERYQDSIRHGKPIPTASLGVNNNRVTGHEGRHRAEAARREGEKTMPVGISTSALKIGREKKRNKKQIQNLHGERNSARAERENVTAGMKGLNKLKALLKRDRK